MHNKKTKVFLLTLCAFSMLVKFSKIQSFKTGVCASQSSRTLSALVFHETLPQPHFAVVNCSDVAMSVFYSPVLTPSLIYSQIWTAVSWHWVYFPPIF